MRGLAAGCALGCVAGCCQGVGRGRERATDAHGGMGRGQMVVVPEFLGMKVCLPTKRRDAQRHKASGRGITVGYRMLLALADVDRATVAKLVEDTDACNRSSVRYHLLRMVEAGLVEEAGLIHPVGCIQKVMTYRLSRRLRGAT